MQKILTIGDLHGKSIWKKVNFSDYDLIIFIGDYLDSFEHNIKEEISNFIDIIHFARNNKNIILLIGNHEAHYFKLNSHLFKKIRGSGFNEKKLYKVYNLYLDNKDLFYCAYQIKNYIWSHAGISQDFYNLFLKDLIDNNFSLAENINLFWNNDNNVISFISKKRGGRENYSSFLWADISETIKNPLKGFHQIVGHSKVSMVTNQPIDDNTSITYVDCLDYKNEFYLLNNFNSGLVSL